MQATSAWWVIFSATRCNKLRLAHQFQSYSKIGKATLTSLSFNGKWLKAANFLESNSAADKTYCCQIPQPKC